VERKGHFDRTVIVAMNMNMGNASGGNKPSRPGTAYYKTRMCSMFESAGACPYGDNCSFAHGEADLREAPQVTSTMLAQRRNKPCNKFFSPQGCPYGDRCNFLHGGTPPPSFAAPGQTQTLALMAPGAEFHQAGESMPGQGPPLQLHHNTKPGPGQLPSNYKTRMCVRFESEAGCPFGDKCHFAHGKADLRDMKSNQAYIQQHPGHQGMLALPSSEQQPHMATAAPSMAMFERRDLSLASSQHQELVAPGLAPPPNSAVAQVRLACTSQAPEDWVSKGGSEIYGDIVQLKSEAVT